MMNSGPEIRVASGGFTPSILKTPFIPLLTIGAGATLSPFTIKFLAIFPEITPGSELEWSIETKKTLLPQAHSRCSSVSTITSNLFDDEDALADRASETSEESLDDDPGPATCGGGGEEEAEQEWMESGDDETAVDEDPVVDSVGGTPISCQSSTDSHESCAVMDDEADDEDTVDLTASRVDAADHPSPIGAETVAHSGSSFVVTDDEAECRPFNWHEYFYQDVGGNLGVHAEYQNEMIRMHGHRLWMCHWHRFESSVGFSRGAGGPQLVLTTPERVNFYLNDLTYYPGASSWADDDDEDEF